MLSLPNDRRYPTLELDPQQRRLKTLEALTAQLEALAQGKPVLMIFEDVHWIDPTSLEVVGWTVDRLRTLGVLLIITYRPEFEPLWIRRPYVTALTLNRLDEREERPGPLARPHDDAAPTSCGCVMDVVVWLGGWAIVVTHDTRIFRFADRIARMEDGRIGRRTTTVYSEPLLAADWCPSWISRPRIWRRCRRALPASIATCLSRLSPPRPRYCCPKPSRRSRTFWRQDAVHRRLAATKLISAHLSFPDVSIPGDLLALAHDPHHDAKHPSSRRRNLSPNWPEVMKLR